MFTQAKQRRLFLACFASCPAWVIVHAPETIYVTSSKRPRPDLLISASYANSLSLPRLQSLCCARIAWPAGSDRYACFAMRDFGSGRSWERQVHSSIIAWKLYGQRSFIGYSHGQLAGTRPNFTKKLPWGRTLIYYSNDIKETGENMLQSHSIEAKSSTAFEDVRSQQTNHYGLSSASVCLR